MASSYRITIVHSGLDDFVEHLVSGVRSIAKTLFRKEDFLEFKDFVVTDLDSNALVVYLGNKAGSSDSSVHQKLRKALDEKLPVLPIVRIWTSVVYKRKCPLS